MPRTDFNQYEERAVFNRRARIFEVQLMAEGGETMTEKVRSFWNLDFKDAIKEVAAVQAWWNSGKRIRFAPIEVIDVHFEDELGAEVPA